MSDAKIRRITKLMNELNADGDVKNSGLESAYTSNAYATSVFTANTYLQDALGSAGVPSGTKQIFVQTAAPTGWTKDTTHNDKAMRVVSGSVSSGGSDAFTTTFGSGKTTAGHSLTLSQIPSHSHTIETSFSYGGGVTGEAAHGNGDSAAETISTASSGGGGSHSHNLSGFDLQYVDVIIATKD